MDRNVSETELSSEELCGLAVGGDSAAEETLLLRHRRDVLSRSRSLFLLGGDQEDLIQEGMLGLLRAVRSFDSSRGISFSSYAGTCIDHALSAAVRSAARKKHTPLNTYISFDHPFLNEASTSLGDFQHDPEDQMILQEDFRECLSAIRSQLSGFEVEILGLYLKGMPYSEIAQQVGRPIKSVDNAVQRVRKKLARSIQ